MLVFLASFFVASHTKNGAKKNAALTGKPYMKRCAYSPIRLSKLSSRMTTLPAIVKARRVNTSRYMASDVRWAYTGVVQIESRAVCR